MIRKTSKNVPIKLRKAVKEILTFQVDADASFPKWAAHMEHWRHGVFLGGAHSFAIGGQVRSHHTVGSYKQVMSKLRERGFLKEAHLTPGTFSKTSLPQEHFTKI